MPEMAAHALPLQYSAQKITLASRVLQEALVAFALFVLVFATIRSDPDPIRSDPIRKIRTLSVGHFERIMTM
jgi:hypothetical protein